MAEAFGVEGHQVTWPIRRPQREWMTDLAKALS